MDEDIGKIDESQSNIGSTPNSAVEPLRTARIKCGAQAVARLDD
jgi:hypothetical protein